jgi:hypothetical protein
MISASWDRFDFLPRRHPERTTLSYHKEVPRVTRKAAVYPRWQLTVSGVRV